MKLPPCRIIDGYETHDCPERHLGCHSTCKRYAEYRAYMDDLHRKKQTNLALNEMAINRSNLRGKSNNSLTRWFKRLAKELKYERDRNSR